LDGITVVVIVRRFDQNEMKNGDRRFCHRHNLVASSHVLALKKQSFGDFAIPLGGIFRGIGLRSAGKATKSCLLLMPPPRAFCRRGNIAHSDGFPQSTRNPNPGSDARRHASESIFGGAGSPTPSRPQLQTSELRRTPSIIVGKCRVEPPNGEALKPRTPDVRFGSLADSPRGTTLCLLSP
jgi:hypothetical protein